MCTILSRVEINIDEERKLKTAHCNCVSGVSGLCKHTSALVHFINSERTEGCTDNVQQWQKPSLKRQTLYPKGETIESLFKITPVSPPTFNPDSAKLKNFVNLLTQHNEQNGMYFKCLTIQPKIKTAVSAQPLYPPEFLDKLFFSSQPTFQSKIAETAGLRVVFKNIF